jgi:hypothetical protein
MFKFNKIYFVIFFVLILASLFFYINFYLSGFRASEDKLFIDFANREFKANKNSELEIALKLNSVNNKKISGIDLYFNFDNANLLDYLNFSTLPDNYFDQILINKQATESGKTFLHIALFSKNKQENLVSNIILKLNFKGKKAGDGNIKLNLEKSLVVGTAINNYFVLESNVNSAKISIINPIKTYLFNIKIKLQGVINPTVENKQIKTELILERADSFGAPVKKEFNFKFIDNGIFIGNENFNLALDDDVSYFVYINLDKHLEKKFCDIQPKESSLGKYDCSTANIFIKEGENNFDFSNVYILAGDLDPKDNVINSYDVALVFNNLGKKDKQALEKADVNYDGIVDSQDYSLLIAALSVKSDEE